MELTTLELTPKLKMISRTRKENDESVWKGNVPVDDLHTRKYFVFDNYFQRL